MPGAVTVSLRPAGVGVMRGCDADDGGVPFAVARGCVPVGGGSGGGGGFGLPEESSFPTSSSRPPLG